MLILDSAGAVAALGVGTAIAGLSPNSRIFGPVVRRGPAERVLYLTFDDGPNPGTTEPILEALAVAGAPAAFFMIGGFVRRFPAVAQAVVQAGYGVGNHTQRHPNLVWLSRASVEREIGEAHEAITEVTGTVPTMFRAPYGRYTPAVHRSARRRQYRSFGWWVSARDFERPGPAVIRQRVRARLRPGAIVLLHDGDRTDPFGDRRQTAAALPGILLDAKDAGYSFRALSELPRVLPAIHG
jgi:peptidoglycan/xylan/chitin deacetylase (PgdA/CDA1 family)